VESTRALFLNVDRNKKGFLSAEDFKIFFKSGKDLEKAIKVFDQVGIFFFFEIMIQFFFEKDNNGEISKEEAVR
jgi:hypothetical protein